MTHEVIKWPKIYSGPNMAARIASDDARAELPKARYRAKVKIHGTNCAVQIHPDGSVLAQSRRRLLTPESDHYGFAAWVASNIDVFRTMVGPKTVVLYGELFGAGIHGPETAANTLERRHWGVFAARVGDRWDFSPDGIETFVWRYELVEGAIHPFTIPWYGDPIAPFTNSLGGVSDEVVDMAESVGRSDPLVEELTGREGPGEGVVLFPISGVGAPFKVKSESFVSRDPLPTGRSREVRKMEDRAAHLELARRLASPDRIRQGYDELGGPSRGMFVIGPLLAWMRADIEAECAVELSDAGVGYKQIGGSVARIVREWVTREADRNQQSEDRR